ncbi:TIGR03086 family protein [Geodermatophilus ruber]|uniref:TIGR03086 family protein n=1 Tax=Geodermatophilus ruber TaxID=504800 RepID=A0A1I4H427_9ACTN|nr:TIGR03086 family protein [Geodermatophilus ruber]
MVRLPSMETTRIDLAPQAAEVAGVVAGVRGDQLGNPTPMAGTPVAALLDHLVGLTLAFRLAAEKTPVPGGPSASAEHLSPEWRRLIPAQLDALVAAWQRPSAWEGTAEAGGVTMPAPVAAAVALDEVLVHGWDLAVATGQPYSADPASVEACLGFAAQVAAGPPQPGLFGPPVPVPDDAPALDRLLGLTGRDPGWRPPS